MGSGGGLSFASGLAQGIAKAQDQKEQKEYANLLKKKMQLDVDLEMQKQQIIQKNPELAMVAMGLAKPQDPMEQAVLKMLQGGVNGGGDPGVIPQSGGGAPPPQASPMTFSQSIMPGPPNTQLGEIADYAANYHGVDPSLFRRLVAQESSWNPKAVSPKGAQGLAQLMPGTAQEMGVENPSDPYQNLMGGAGYFKKMLDMFGGDMTKALAAYNAGPGAVQKYGGVPPYAETQKYVKTVSGQGLPQAIASVQVQGQMPQGQQQPGLGLDPKQFALGYLNKKYGYPMDEFTWRTVAGPGGMPYSVPFDKRTNRPMWEAAVPEPVKGEYQDVAGPDRRPQKQAFNPYNQQPIGEPINQPYKVSPQKISMPGGGEAIIPLDEYAWPKKTEQPAGQPGLPPDAIQTAPPKGETSTEAGKIQLAQTGLEALREFRGMIFDTDGKLNKTNLFNASVGTPWSNGRRLEQLAQNAIDAVIRAATGAGLNNQELTNYTKRYVPSVFDDEKTVRAKVQQLDSFLNGYLEKMDPAGTQRLRTGLPGPAAMKQIKTAEEFLKMKGGQ